MWFKRMPLEDWFDTYQYEVQYDVGESAVKYLTFDDLNIDLGKLPLRYGYHLGRPDLREEISKQYEGLSYENVVVTTGASEANFILFCALMKPDYHVVIEHPNYPSLYEVPRSLGCKVDLCSLRFEKQFLDSLARDSQGNLVYLPANTWRLERTTEDWPEIQFLQTMEIN